MVSAIMFVFTILVIMVLLYVVAQNGEVVERDLTNHINAIQEAVSRDLKKMANSFNVALDRINETIDEKGNANRQSVNDITNKRLAEFEKQIKNIKDKIGHQVWVTDNKSGGNPAPAPSIFERLEGLETVNKVQFVHKITENRGYVTTAEPVAKKR